MAIRQYVADHKSGAFSFAAPSDVTQLTGREAESFEAIAHRYGSDPSLRPRPESVKTLAEFAVLPMVPAYDLERYRRRMHFVAPQHPELAMQNPRWIAERSAQARLNAVPSADAASLAA